MDSRSDVPAVTVAELKTLLLDAIAVEAHAESACLRRDLAIVDAAQASVTCGEEPGVAGEFAASVLVNVTAEFPDALRRAEARAARAVRIIPLI